MFPVSISINNFINCVFLMVSYQAQLFKGTYIDVVFRLLFQNVQECSFHLNLFIPNLNVTILPVTLTSVPLIHFFPQHDPNDEHWPQHGFIFFLFLLIYLLVFFNFSKNTQSGRATATGIQKKSCRQLITHNGHTFKLIEW